LPSDGHTNLRPGHTVLSLMTERAGQAVGGSKLPPGSVIQSSRIFSLAGLNTAPTPELVLTPPSTEYAWGSEAVALAQERAKATAKSQCVLLQMGGVAATAEGSVLSAVKRQRESEEARQRIEEQAARETEEYQRNKREALGKRMEDRNRQVRQREQAQLAALALNHKLQEKLRAGEKAEEKAEKAAAAAAPPAVMPTQSHPSAAPSAPTSRAGTTGTAAAAAAAASAASAAQRGDARSAAAVGSASAATAGRCQGSAIEAMREAAWRTQGGTSSRPRMPLPPPRPTQGPV